MPIVVYPNMGKERIEKPAFPHVISCHVKLARLPEQLNRVQRHTSHIFG